MVSSRSPKSYSREIKKKNYRRDSSNPDKRRALHQALVFDRLAQATLPGLVSYLWLSTGRIQAAIDPGKFGSGHQPDKPSVRGLVPDHGFRRHRACDCQPVARGHTLASSCSVNSAACQMLAASHHIHSSQQLLLSPSPLFAGPRCHRFALPSLLAYSRNLSSLPNTVQRQSQEDTILLDLFNVKNYVKVVLDSVTKI